jgi:hypothetical protein
MVTVDSGKEFSVEARGAFDDVDDISAVPDTVHAGLRRHPLAPIAGPHQADGLQTDKSA